MSVPPFLALPSGVEVLHIQTPDARLATLQAGHRQASDPETSEPVRALMVAGFTGSKEDFIAVLAPLADAGVHAVSYDQLGQYQSPSAADESRFTLTALAADVVALSRTLWPTGPRPHVVGHSLGGLISRRAVLAAPHEFASLTLLASGPAGVPEHQRPPLELLRRVLPDTGLDVVWQAKQSIDEAKGITAPPGPIGEFLRERWLASSPHGLRAKAEILLTESDRSDALAELDLPVLVMFGEADDVWWPDLQRDMARRLNAGTVAVPGVGHSPAAEAPEVTADALLEFWRAARSEPPE